MDFEAKIENTKPNRGIFDRVRIHHHYGLMEVLVPSPSVLPSRGSRDTTEADKDEYRIFREVTKNHNLEKAVENYKRIVILGGPASGKTTLLKYYGLTLMEEYGSFLLPVFVSVIDYGLLLVDEPGLSLVRFIQKYVEEHMDVSPNFVMSCLKSGSCIILLDGLDEVIDHRLRKAVASRIDDFTAIYGESNNVIVTSRKVGYTESQLSRGFEHFSILEFENSDISDYIDRWYKVIEQIDKIESGITSIHADQLKKIIFTNKSLNELSKIPLFITILCLLNKIGIPLPSKKIELYQTTINALV